MVRVSAVVIKVACNIKASDVSLRICRRICFALRKLCQFESLLLPQCPLLFGSNCTLCRCLSIFGSALRSDVNVVLFHTVSGMQDFADQSGETSAVTSAPLLCASAGQHSSLISMLAG